MWGFEEILAFISRIVGYASDAASATGSVMSRLSYLTSVSRASGNLKSSSDAEVSLAGVATAIKRKECIAGLDGSVRVSFDIRGDLNVADSYYGRIYINGVAVGTERTPVSPRGTYQTFTEDFNVKAGDAVQLYIRTAQTGTVTYIRNFRLYYDVISAPVQTL